MKYAITVALVVVLGLVGNQDYELEKDLEREYCERVSSGIHGNYDNLECGEVK